MNRYPSRAPIALLSALLLLSLPGMARAEPATGTATVIDAETVEVDGQRFRLRGIDAPEPGQQCLSGSRAYDCGKIAATALMDLVAGGTVTCEPLAPGQTDAAPVATCRSDGYDLSEGMVYTGWAMADPASGREFFALESGAKAKRRGMWRGAFIAPWQWRAASTHSDSGLPAGRACGVGEIVVTESSVADCDLFRLTGGPVYELPLAPADPPADEICLCGQVLDSDDTCGGRPSIREPNPFPRSVCP